MLFVFLFLAPYARTTRYEEAFFFLGKPRKKSLASLARLMIMKIRFVNSVNTRRIIIFRDRQVTPLAFSVAPILFHTNYFELLSPACGICFAIIVRVRTCSTHV